LWKVFGRKYKEVGADWKKVQNEELHDLHCSANIIWLISSRKMRWSTLVARMEEKRNALRVLVWRSLKNGNMWKT
jgi:hypothetical protein